MFSLARRVAKSGPFCGRIYRCRSCDSAVLICALLLMLPGCTGRESPTGGYNENQPASKGASAPTQKGTVGTPRPAPAASHLEGTARPDGTPEPRLRANAATNGAAQSSAPESVDPASTPKEATFREPRLIAEPNPVPDNSKTTMISWDVGSNAWIGEVYVSKDGGPEVLFARGKQGTKQATWIVQGNYEFSLYIGKSRRERTLERLTVTRSPTTASNSR